MMESHQRAKELGSGLEGESPVQTRERGEFRVSCEVLLTD